MTQRINLPEKLFDQEPYNIYQDEHFTVTTMQYDTGVAGLKISNNRGYIVILPFQGFMIWDAVFDQLSLKMTSAFDKPYSGTQVTDTYGMFQFTSGVLASGTPSETDTHSLHGEYPMTKLDHIYLEIDQDNIIIGGEYEYVKGFGYHYRTHNTVIMHAGSALIDIGLEVTNLSNYQTMPLQYLNHLNYCYVDGATMTANIPENTLKIRQSIPSHVKPTASWRTFNQALQASGEVIEVLDNGSRFDPEIVYMSTDLRPLVDRAVFKMSLPNGPTFVTSFNTKELPFVTRWLLNNPDQQVAAFAIPGTSHPDGYNAASQAGTLIHLAAGGTQSFTVTTGIGE